MGLNLEDLDNVDVKLWLNTNSRAARAAAYVLASGWRRLPGCDPLAHAQRELADNDGFPPPGSPEDIREAAKALMDFAAQLEHPDGNHHNLGT